MKFHKGSKKMKGEDEDLFTAAALVVAFIVSFNTLPCAVKQPQHVKASETAFFFQPPWLHPLPLTNVLGSQGATVLLNGPFLFPNPKAQAVAEVALPPPPPPQPPPSHHIMGLNCIWPLWKTMAEGLSFFRPSQCWEDRPLYSLFSLWSASNSKARWQDDLCSVNMGVYIGKGIVWQFWLASIENTGYRSNNI